MQRRTGKAGVTDDEHEKLAIFKILKKIFRWTGLFHTGLICIDCYTVVPINLSNYVLVVLTRCTYWCLECHYCTEIIFKNDKVTWHQSAVHSQNCMLNRPILVPILTYFGQMFYNTGSHIIILRRYRLRLFVNISSLFLDSVFFLVKSGDNLLLQLFQFGIGGCTEVMVAHIVTIY